MCDHPTGECPSYPYVCSNVALLENTGAIRTNELCPTVSSRRTAVRRSDHIKRPENAFILFRRSRIEYHQQCYGRKLRQADLSKLISSDWRGLNTENRQPWHDLAKRKKLEHLSQYPNYVYRPAPRKRKAPHRESDKGRTARSHVATAAGTRGAAGGTQPFEFIISSFSFGEVQTLPSGALPGPSMTMARASAVVAITPTLSPTDDACKVPWTSTTPAATPPLTSPVGSGADGDLDFLFPLPESATIDDYLNFLFLPTEEWPM